jgi:hypothetical protein
VGTEAGIQLETDVGQKRVSKRLKQKVEKPIRRPGAVAHICNPSYLGGRDQENQFEAGQGKKKKS